MSFRIVVPARYASSRLPGKPLADIAGKPMVVRVVEAVAGCGAEEILVATDDARVADAARAHGIEAVMTSATHASGTDRIAEVAAQRRWADETVVVNVQGDEPLLDPALVVAVARALEADPAAAIATAAHPLADAGEFLNPNVVKVVTDAAGRALYFSRAPIPWPRDAYSAGTAALPAGLAPLRHVGLYAYRCGFLHRFGSLTPAPPEQWEALEQMRALWHGFPIRVVVSESAPMAGVDTEADLERVRQFFASIER